MPLPRQSSYFIVAWANGVNSVHPSFEQAETHIKRLRGEDPEMSYVRDSAPKWRQTPARVIEVAHTNERIL